MLKLYNIICFENEIFRKAQLLYREAKIFFAKTVNIFQKCSQYILKNYCKRSMSTCQFKIKR